MTAAPTPRELEERVARAIHRTFPAADSDPWDAAVARYKAYGLPGNPPHVARALSAAEAALAVVREALREPTEEMLDRAVSFALNVKIGGEYGWTQYMRDLWQHQMSASPLGGEP